MKAFSYLRVSGRGQIEGDGFPRQREAIERYAQANGLTIAHEYRDEGVSGTRETMDRPGWSDLIAALLANGVRTIIVERLDRLARDLMVQELCISDLKAAGFTLISVMEPDLMSTDPTRVLVRQLLGAIAQYEKSQIVLKLKAARDRKKKATGRCEGRKPYGYFEGEFPVLERMKDLRSRGLTWDNIANALTANGDVTRTGRPWDKATIWRILERESRDPRVEAVKNRCFDPDREVPALAG